MERRREIGLMTGTWRKAGQQTVGLSTHMRGVGPGYRLAERGYSRLTAIGVGNDRKFPICNDPKFLTLGLSLKAYWTVLLALPTERDRCADVQMGDQDVVEAPSGPGRLEGGAVEAVRGESSGDVIRRRNLIPRIKESQQVSSPIGVETASRITLNPPVGVALARPTQS